MKHFENALKFFLKNYIIAVPILFALAIPALMRQSAAFSLSGKIWNLFSSLWGYGISNPLRLMETVLPYFFATSTAGAVGILLKLVAMPAASGMIKKSIEGD